MGQPMSTKVDKSIGHYAGENTDFCSFPPLPSSSSPSVTSIPSNFATLLASIDANQNEAGASSSSTSSTSLLSQITLASWRIALWLNDSSNNNKATRAEDMAAYLKTFDETILKKK